MRYTERYLRNHLENMANFSQAHPPGGFRTFTPDSSEPHFTANPSNSA